MPKEKWMWDQRQRGAHRSEMTKRVPQNWIAKDFIDNIQGLKSVIILTGCHKA